MNTETSTPDNLTQPRLTQAKAALLAPPKDEAPQAGKLDQLRSQVRRHPGWWIGGAMLGGLLVAKKSPMLRALALTIGSRAALNAVRRRLSSSL